MCPATGDPGAHFVELGGTLRGEAEADVGRAGLVGALGGVGDPLTGQRDSVLEHVELGRCARERGLLRGAGIGRLDDDRPLRDDEHQALCGCLRGSDASRQAGVEVCDRLCPSPAACLFIGAGEQAVSPPYERRVPVGGGGGAGGAARFAE